MARPTPEPAINFQSTGGSKSAITGDFVLTAKEVNPVLKDLRENGIEVTAVHNHMLDDQPRLFFVHFWANDETSKLLLGLHKALSDVSIAKKQRRANGRPEWRTCREAEPAARWA